MDLKNDAMIQTNTRQDKKPADLIYVDSRPVNDYVEGVLCPSTRVILLGSGFQVRESAFLSS